MQQLELDFGEPVKTGRAPVTMELKGKTYRLQLVGNQLACRDCAFCYEDCGNIRETDECLMHPGHAWVELPALPTAYGCAKEVTGDKLCDSWCGVRSDCVHS